MIRKTTLRLRGGRFVPANSQHHLSPSLSSILWRENQNDAAEDETIFDIGSESISCPGFFSEIDWMD
jgi:hypothetical protein